MKKRALTLLLALVMCLSLCTPALAAETMPNEDGYLTIVSRGGRTLDMNSAIEVLMEKANYSYNDALSAYRQATARGQTLVERWVVCDTVMNNQIEIGCLVEVHSGSGHSNFGEVEATWSILRTTGYYTWSPAYANAEVGPPYKTSITFSTRGNLERTVETTSTIGAQLEAAGFEVSGSITTTTTYRYTTSLSGKYTIGDFLA